MRPGDQPPCSARQRADEHHATPASANHAWKKRARSVNRTKYVDRHDAIEIGVPIGLIPIIVPRTNRGVENQTVDFAGLLAPECRSQPVC